MNMLRAFFWFGIGSLLVPAQVAPVRDPATSPEDFAAGGRIYRSHCAECHGVKGQGGRGPDLTSGELRHGSTDEALLKNISRGIPGTEMPGIFFSENQVWQVVSFVRSLSARTPRGSLPGNPAVGGALFRDKGGCLVCHMVAGEGGRSGPDLSRIGGMRSAAHLRSAILNPDAEVRSPYWQFTVVFKDGRKLSGRRMNEDTYSIRLLDGGEQLHSIPKESLAGIQVDKSSAMPEYASALRPAEIDDLVAYLASLRGR